MLNKKTADSIVSLVALLAVTAFLLIGFTAGFWQFAWLVFLLIPITAIITGMLVTGKKDVAGMVTGLVALLAVITYMILGFAFGLWHPGWLVFMAIPISATIAGLFAGHGQSDPGTGQGQDEQK